MSNLKGTILDALDKIRTDYNDNYHEKYFTESDVVIGLARHLANCNSDGAGVHSELRPFFGDSKSREVIGSKKSDWVHTDKTVEGACVDLAVVKYGVHLKKASSLKANIQTEYWRMPLYPVEGFKAAIEVKVRVKGNVHAIENDMKKLSLIRSKNNSCLCYVLILDALAKDKQNNKLKKLMQEYLSKGIITVSNIE